MLVLDGRNEQWFVIFGPQNRKIGRLKMKREDGRTRLVFDFLPQYRIIREKLLESGEPIRLLKTL